MNRICILQSQLSDPPTGVRVAGLAALLAVGLFSAGCPDPCSPVDEAGSGPPPGSEVSTASEAQAQSVLFADDAAFRYPDKVNVVQHYFNFPNMKFDVQNGETCEKMGEIESVFFSMALQFKLHDANGNQIARARRKIWSWGVEIEVFDHNDIHIADVEERVFESWMKVRTRYDINTPDGTLLATSEKFDFYGTDFRIKDANGGAMIAEAKRGFWESWAHDVWHVDLHNQDKVDPRILVFVPAFKTYVDAHREHND